MPRRAIKLSKCEAILALLEHGKAVVGCGLAPRRGDFLREQEPVDVLEAEPHREARSSERGLLSRDVLRATQIREKRIG
jgi:hypothetical protein